MMETDNSRVHGVSEDITVATMGHCLLCLVKLPPKTSSSADGPSLTSLHNLSRYLRIDLKKLLQNRKVTLPKQLKEKLSMNKRQNHVGTVGVKGLLCEDCAFINKQFSEVFLQLERIQLEVASSLKLIRWKLMEADEAGQAQLNQSGKLWKEELALVEALRKEAVEKCSLKLTSLLPPCDAKGDPESDTETDDPTNPKPKMTVDPLTGLVKCGYCVTRTFKDELGFRKHFQDCHVASRVKAKCMDCKEEFEDVDAEREHWRVYYGVTYECYGCKALFPKCCLSKHQKAGCEVLKVGLSRLDCCCRLCRKPFTSVAAFQRHLGKFHKEKALPCSACGKKFKLPIDLGSHRSAAHGIKGVPERRISVPITKTQLAFLENDAPKVIADGEGGSAMKTELLSADEDQDMEDMTTECTGNGMDIALAIVDTPAPLEVHNDLEYIGKSEDPAGEMVINPAKGTYRCALCSTKEFRSELHFMDHYKTEHLQIRFKCGSCSETFDKRLRYVKHYRQTHLNIKWECFACGTRCQSKCQFKKHLAKHSAEVIKVDVCSCRKCRKGFASYSNFRNHHRHVHEQTTVTGQN